MKHLNTTAIVLARTDYGEADRILTLLTPDQGKIKGFAKGVRKSKSKMAGGIELFSVSEVSYIIGKSEINTIISTRLVKHYGNIVKDLDRTNATYESIKLVNKATEDAPEEAYFNLLKRMFEALDTLDLDLHTVILWFDMQLLKLSGHMPNTKDDINGERLNKDKTYNFDYEQMRFTPAGGKKGQFNANHIKFLRLGFAAVSPQTLAQVQQVQSMVEPLQPLVRSMLGLFVRV